jgi:hypothetical protein
MAVMKETGGVERRKAREFTSTLAEVNTQGR